MSSKINVLKSYRETSTKFGLTRHSIRFKIKPSPPLCNPRQFIQEACNEIVLAVTRDLKENCKVGFIFEVAHKRDGWLPFRLASEITTDQVWGILEKILQSNEHITIEDHFTIVATVIFPPQGRGRGRRYNTYNEESLMRKGLITISNKDSLCLPRALVTAIAKITKDKEYDLIRRDRKQRQTKLAQKLVEDTGVTIPANGCGIPELQKFQDYLQDYCIVVYPPGKKGRDVIFKSRNSGKKINLLLKENHFDVISSLTAAFCCSYYCETCSVPYNNKGGHRCDKRCPCCLNYTACPDTETKMKCDDCKRNFRGSQCFAIHKTTEICSKLRRCHKCLKNFTDDEHICGLKFCKICKNKAPQDHYCYIQVDTKTPKHKGIVFVFFDLETVIGEEYHKGGNLFKPNLCVQHKRCSECIINDAPASSKCNLCGNRVISDFDGTTDVIKEFMDDILQTRQNKKVSKLIAIAHNGQSFDHQFILNYILTSTSLEPKIIMRGSKIIRLELENVILLDSLNYFPMSLGQLPKAFDLSPSMKKGYFPHLFNIPENQKYKGVLPDMKFYDPDSMKPEERKVFLEWYKKNKTKPFNFQEEIIAYCKADVVILEQACLKFRSMFLKQCNVCPFTEACTIASACNKVFRRNFLKRDTIGIIPPRGYRLTDNQSLVAIEWLVFMELTRKMKIQHAAKGREAIVQGVKVDRYCQATNEIFEFHGCYYHGCPECFPDNDGMILKYQNTKSRTDRLKSFGYTVTEMWECKFNQIREQALTLIGNHPLLLRAPLNPRDAFYGGRTGNVKTFYACRASEKIRYLDVCSLYPYICKYSAFPIGHPEVLIDPSDLPPHGLAKCRVLPPQDLFHPVLPVKMNNKTMFVLCRSCGEELNQEECSHSDDERALTGTWVVEEVKKAIEKGYKLLQVFEAWSYKTAQLGKEEEEGLFTAMMDKFLKMKQEASGWPHENMTHHEKEEYISNFLTDEKIHLEFEKIVKNPGLRSLAKLMLNSFWGKFGQRDNLGQTEIIRTPEALYKLAFNSPDVLLNSIIPINDETILVNWEKQNEAVEEQPTTNVAIAAYVTAHARLKLYTYLEMLEERVLYYDTDSVIFVTEPDLPDPRTGHNIGDLTDELVEFGIGSYINEFVSGGPKNYAYTVVKPTGEKHMVCKVKGIKLTYSASQLINFETMKALILKDDLRPDPVWVTSNVFRRTKEHQVITRQETKMYIPNSKKRKFMNHNSVPYGYKKKRSERTSSLSL